VRNYAGTAIRQKMVVHAAELPRDRIVIVGSQICDPALHPGQALSGVDEFNL
jgi:hypothetical protein